MITTIALAGSIIGALLIAEKKISGFYFWSVANTLWLIDSIGRSDVQQSILWFYYLITCALGIYSWGKK
jgi:hypothetical protein